MSLHVILSSNFWACNIWGLPAFLFSQSLHFFSFSFSSSFFPFILSVSFCPFSSAQPTLALATKMLVPSVLCHVKQHTAANTIIISPANGDACRGLEARRTASPISHHATPGSGRPPPDARLVAVATGAPRPMISPPHHIASSWACHRHACAGARASLPRSAEWF